MKLKELLNENNIQLNDHNTKLVEAYNNELIHVNEIINLVSRKDVEKTLENHILPCLVFSDFLNNFVGDFIDIGTGGGLPGIIFGIHHPLSAGLLVDSTYKKINSVNGFIEKLGLKNIKGYCSRVEDKEFIRRFSHNFDLVISRATADLSKIIEYSVPLLKKKKNSIIALMKGGDLESEINNAKIKYQKIKIEKFPMPYTPGNIDNVNKKFILIVEHIYA